MKRSVELSQANTSDRVLAASCACRTRHRYGTIVLALIYLFVVGILVGGTEKSSAQSTVLFNDFPFAVVAPQIDDPFVQRVRYVAPDFKLLAGIEPGVGRLLLNLFDDINYLGVVDQVTVNPSGSITWAGYLEDVGLGSFLLVTRNGVMVGTIKMPGAFYRIAYIGDGVHAVYEINEAAFPPELFPQTASGVERDGRGASPTVDDGSI